MYQAYLPTGLRIEDELPSSLSKFTDDAKYFIHKVYEQRILNKRRAEDFIPLKMEYLRRVISFRKYPYIKETLLTRSILETDDYFIRGEKCIGYRLGANFRSKKYKKEPFTSSKILEKIKRYEKERDTEIELDVHRHLWMHLKQIRIDYNGAFQELEGDDWINNQIAVDMIQDRNWFFRPDKYGRVHTNITNLKTCFRKHLTARGKQIVEVDIVNSQPFFFGIVLMTMLENEENLTSFNRGTPEFWYGGNSEVNLVVNSRYNNRLNLINSQPLPHTLSLLRDIFPSDVTNYLTLVQDGQFYEYLWDYFNIPVESRKSFKVKLFSEVFFCKNGWKSKSQQMFQEVFPTAYKIIQELKKKDYKALSRHLQKVESAFVINKVVRRCMELVPDMFVTTIHDSFLLHEHDVDFVLGIVKREFETWGLVPTLKVKKDGNSSENMS